MRHFLSYLLLIGLSPLLYLHLFAQQQTNTLLGELTVEKIMRDPIWFGGLPSDAFWSDDSKEFYFKWNPDANLGDSLYVYSLTTQDTKKVSPKEQKELHRYAEYNVDKTKKLFTQKGQLFIEDLSTNETKQLTQPPFNGSSPHFVGNQIAFISKNSLFLYNQETGETKQLVNYKRGAKKTSDKDKEDNRSDYEKWIADEEMSLIKIFQRREEKSEAIKAYTESQKEEDEQMTTVHYGDFSIYNQQLAPNGRFASFQLERNNDGEQKTKVPSYVTKSGLTENLAARSNVGRDLPSFKLGITDIEKDTTYYASVNQLPEIFTRSPFAKDFDPEKPKAVYLSSPIWSDDGEKAIVIVQSLDNKDRWITELIPETGELKNLDHQHNEAWIGGPGISQWRGWTSNDIGFLPKNEKNDDVNIWFQSEESGWSHLYLLNLKTGKKKQLTKGKFEVFNPQISKDNRYWYFTSSQEDLGERHFYRMLLYGGKPEKLTTMKGNNSVTLSPNEKWLLIRHSYSNQPWELYLQENRLNATAKKITNSLSPEFESYNWRVPELITFKASDGEDIRARLYRPENPQLYGPAVVFVHGAGYLQNAHHWWSTYYREYMFHNLLVDKGYTVLDIDYRGSSGYGSKFRTDIYRHMGGKDLSDHIDGAKYLIDNHSIDRDKIGIYGGSYGGFITLMALFTEPDVFACGAALRSVTDWAHYNHGYTANRLNIPWEDSVAYRQSSPIYFAEGLKKPLVMLHGMIDTNVHFQDVVRLSQRLIELGKEDWELAVFPLEGHSFVEPESWTDEYKRILKLFEENLK